MHQPGDILLDKYRIEALIGRGAFAEVYRVTNLVLRVPRALKILRRDAPGIGSTEYGDYRGRFELEAQLGARLNAPTPNPHLIQVYDFRAEGDLLVLEMEYAPGGSLADRLARLPEAGQWLPVDEAVRIALDVAQGLAALHSVDAVHRDLKPSNILFDSGGHAKVADLGLAQTPGGPSQRTLLGSQAPPHPGTPGYKSPEQEQTRDYLTPASDVYALGAVLFEMLTGRMLRSQRPGTRARTLRGDVPQPLDELLARMVAEAPAGRPWDGAEAAKLLGEIGQRIAADKRTAAEAEAKAKAESERARQAEAEAKVKAEAERVRQAEQERQRQQEAERRRQAEAEAKVKAEAERARQAEQEAERARQAEAAERARRARELEDKQQRAAALRRTLPWAGMLAALALILGIWHPWTAPPAATPAPAPIATTIVAAPAPSTEAPTAAPPTQAPEPTQAPKAAPVLGIGSTWTSPADGMVQVYVPAGEFLMGSAEGDTDAYSDEKPQHKVTLDAYWIDRTEVTNAMFAQFVAASGHKTDAEEAGKGYVYNPTSKNWEETAGADWQHQRGPGSDLAGLDQHPAVLVSWNDATAYCAWAGRRLPTEAEWEKAARGTDGRKFPWGNQNVAGDLLNFADRNLDVDWADKNVDDGYQFTAPVGSYPKGGSPYGALDMAGNVWEWAADWYGETYYASSPVANPKGPDAGQYRVLRGGSWGGNQGFVRAAVRLRYEPDGRSDGIGFRCARS